MTGPHPGQGGRFGTIRVRLIAGLLGFVVLALVGVALTVSGRSERDSLLEAFSGTWGRAQAAARLERCVTDLHRQSSLLGQGFDGLAGQALAPTVRDGFNAGVQKCEDVLPALQDDPAWAAATAEVAELLRDLRDVVGGLGVDHVAAITRQALEVDPVAEQLVTTRFPQLREQLARELERLEAEIGELGQRGDRTLLAALIAPLLLFAFVSAILLKRVIGSLSSLQEAMKAFGSGNFSYRLALGGRDEFTAVAARIHTMADQLAENQEALSKYANELERSLASLREAQQTAIEQQKLAALGELVAGVSHEVNTPLGVAVTSASLADEYVRELREASESGTATKGLLRRLSVDLAEVMRPLQDNLARAARLISSFKQVAVDRGTVSTRVARLDQWAHAVIQSLAPALRQHRVAVAVDLPPVEVRMAAGELEQIVSNLVMNACMHAYPPPGETDPQAPTGPSSGSASGSFGRNVRLTGRLEVTGNAQRTFVLSVGDDGAGMPPDVAARVFEPFFTTRRGRGGSGLGMHIVHQLVLERFDGRIALETAPGKGTLWTLSLPMPTSALSLDVGSSTAEFAVVSSQGVPTEAGLR